VSEIIGQGPAGAVLEALMASLEVSLQAVQNAAPLDRIKAIEAAKKRLMDFSDSTRAQNLADPAEVKAVRDIDQLALDTISSLTVQQVDLGVGALQQGARRLRTLTGALNQQTAGAATAAKSIALQPVKKAVETMTAMVNSVKALKANLKAADPDEAKVAAEIDKLVSQFETLRRAVTGTGG
jgi:hypothetical protein